MCIAADSGPVDVVIEPVPPIGCEPFSSWTISSILPFSVVCFVHSGQYARENTPNVPFVVRFKLKGVFLLQFINSVNFSHNHFILNDFYIKKHSNEYLTEKACTHVEYLKCKLKNSILQTNFPLDFIIDKKSRMFEYIKCEFRFMLGRKWLRKRTINLKALH